MTEFQKERLEEYREHLKYSSRHPIEELQNTINNEQVLLDPLDGIAYSFVANGPEDIWRFIYRFKDQMPFVGYLIEELNEDDVGFDQLNDDQYNMLPERQYVEFRYNEYFDQPVEMVFYPEQVGEQYARENFRLKYEFNHIEYPCAIQWVGEDTFDFGSGITKRLCSIIPLTNRDKYFIQA